MKLSTLIPITKTGRKNIIYCMKARETEIKIKRGVEGWGEMSGAGE